MFKLTFIDKRVEVGDAVSFFFKPEKPFFWQAGQYLHYKIDDPNADERKTDRYFTISSAPHEGEIYLTTRLLAEKRSTFKNNLDNLKTGDIIQAEGPDGDFTVTDTSAQFVFIAGGIGITPYWSILLDLDHKTLPMNITLLYANKNYDFVFKDKLEELAQKHSTFQIKYIVDPQKIDQTLIKENVPDLSKPIFYISGPEPMVKSTEKMLLEMGIPDNRIKRDFFPGYDWP